jgi:mono/diheme cytochrome c family protein
MNLQTFIVGVGIVALLSGSLVVPGAAVAFEQPAPATDDAEVGPTFLVSLGGKLYDDLWRVLDQAPPVEANPAFPAGGLYSTRDSWRCVTCHGWDYSGAEVGGRRFPSLAGLNGLDPVVIAERISDPKHPFPAKDVSELTITLLAVFLSQGQYVASDFLDAKGEALGDPEGGQAIFEGACINCHQIDGRRYLNGERGDRSSLGWVIRTRPTQALHKIMNGVPGAEMLSLRFLADSQISDLFAYLQTLDPGER